MWRRIALLACALCSCGSPAKQASNTAQSSPVEEVRHPVPSDFTFEFAEDGSYGGSYRYTIDAQGNAVQSDEWGQRKRRHEYRLPAKSVQRLWRVINDNQFFLLPENDFEEQANTAIGECTTITVNAKRRKHAVTVCNPNVAAFNSVADAFHYEKKRATLVE